MMARVCAQRGVGMHARQKLAPNGCLIPPGVLSSQPLFACFPGLFELNAAREIRTRHRKCVYFNLNARSLACSEFLYHVRLEQQAADWSLVTSATPTAVQLGRR